MFGEGDGELRAGPKLYSSSFYVFPLQARACPPAASPATAEEGKMNHLTNEYLKQQMGVYLLLP